MYRWLARHPGVVRASRKEVHFFDLRFDRGLNWYRSHFPLETTLRWRRWRSGHATVTGEASPYYLFDPPVVERVHTVLPDARFVVLLRDPVERAVSHYRHAVEGGREHLSLSDALDAEPQRMDDGPFARWAYSYVGRGLYVEQLERWFHRFPPEQFLVLVSEEVFDAPAASLDRTFEFLGLPPRATGRAQDEYRPVNRAEVDRPVDDRIRARLVERFREPNERLAMLLGRALPWD